MQTLTLRILGKSYLMEGEGSLWEMKVWQAKERYIIGLIDGYEFSVIKRDEDYYFTLKKI